MRGHGYQAHHNIEVDVRPKFFLQSDPSLQDMTHDFTLDMFSVEGIEVLRYPRSTSPIDTYTYIKEYVTKNCVKIVRNVEKHDHITDGPVHFQIVKFCMNTWTQYISSNITLPPKENFLSVQHVHVDTVIAHEILRKGTRGSFRKKDYDLTVTRLQMTHTDGGFDLTPNAITQTSTKVVMTSWFLGLVVSLPLDEQTLCLPNQMIHDPDTWTTPHLLQLKREYEILVDKYGCVVQETFTVQDPPVSPTDTLLDSRSVLPPSQCTVSFVSLELRVLLI